MVTAEEKARQDAIKKTIFAQHATLKACGATGIRLNITVERGVAKPLLVSGKATPEQMKCIETKLQQLKLQHAAALTVVLDF